MAGKFKQSGRAIVHDDVTDDGAAAALAEAVLGARVFVDVVVPGTDIAGKMRILARNESRRVASESRRELMKAGFPVDGTALGAFAAVEEWNAEVAVRTLAVAVREPSDTDRALADLDDWNELTDEQIGVLWQRYEDLRIEVDPIGEGAPGLSETELIALRDAAKKGERALLMSFGSRKLALFAIASAAAPSS